MSTSTSTSAAAATGAAPILDIDLHRRLVDTFAEIQAGKWKAETLGQWKGLNGKRIWVHTRTNRVSYFLGEEGAIPDDGPDSFVEEDGLRYITLYGKYKLEANHRLGYDAFVSAGDYAESLVSLEARGWRLAEECDIDFGMVAIMYRFIVSQFVDGLSHCGCSDDNTEVVKRLCPAFTENRVAEYRIACAFAKVSWFRSMSVKLLPPNFKIEFYRSGNVSARCGVCGVAKEPYKHTDCWKKVLHID